MYKQSHWYENDFIILMQIYPIFKRNVVHLAPFWQWEFLDLENGLLLH